MGSTSELDVGVTANRHHSEASVKLFLGLSEDKSWCLWDLMGFDQRRELRI